MLLYKVIDYWTAEVLYSLTTSDFYISLDRFI